MISNKQEHSFALSMNILVDFYAVLLYNPKNNRKYVFPGGKKQ